MQSAKYIWKCALAGTLLVVFTTSGCKKFLDIGAPKTELVSELVFKDEATAINALVSMYGEMMAGNNFVSDYASTYLGYAADEFLSNGSPQSPYYTNSLTAGNNDDFWSRAYKFIYNANLVREGTDRSTLADTTKKQIKGETLFIRAFCHFYMVNLFGDIPYMTSTDYRVTNIAVREPVTQVYDKILADLLEARNLVKADYLDGNNKPYTERIRPNKAVCTALIARVYLYMGNWKKAEEEATTLINNTAYSLPTDLKTVFLKNSAETIWQLQPSSPTYTNGFLATNYIWDASFGYNRPVLTNNLFNACEPGDKRQSDWMGTYASPTAGNVHFSWKYKSKEQSAPSKEYFMVFRLAEQYLIRAEASAKLNNVADAVKDLNKLRDRARTLPTDLPPYSETISQDACIAAVAHERQIELFTEWGHRWLDLKRTGKANEVLGPLKGNTWWQGTDVLFPIPLQQISLNPNMTNAQNPGYPN